MRKIAFWRTVAAGYLFVFGQLGRFIRIAGPWIVAFIVLFAVAIPVTIVVPTRATSVALGATALLLMMASYVAFSVAWHRAILLGEQRPFGENFRFGRREWRFLGFGIVCVLLILVPAALIVAASAVFGVIAGSLGVENGKAAGVVILSLVVLVVYATSARLMLAFPAVAVDEGPPYLARAWARTRGNALRLFFGMVICALPLSLLTSLLDAAAGKLAAENAAFALAAQAVLLIANFLGVAVYVGFLSFAYDQLGGITSDPAHQEAPTAET
jgi:hypothetical protein